MDRAHTMNQNSRPILPLSYSWKVAFSLIFTQNDNKTQGTSSHFRLMIQAHESLRGNFGSRGLEGQEVCLVKFQRFKVDKRNMLFGVSSSIP